VGEWGPRGAHASSVPWTFYTFTPIVRIPGSVSHLNSLRRSVRNIARGERLFANPWEADNPKALAPAGVGGLEKSFRKF
jgi:hypothetical protein